VALRTAIKPLPVACLAVWAWDASGGRRGGRLLAAGLLVSAAGDALLEHERLFLPGLAVFLVAHLSYTASFVGDTRALRLARAAPFAAWGLAAYATVRPGLGELALPVAAYVVVICVMMWRAAALIDHRPGQWWATAGAILFGASDTLIALDRFRTRLPAGRYAVILLYWAGQAALAWSARRSAGVAAPFEYHHAGPPAA
jgi:uncharacterized membrane protein YhhN